MFDTLEIFSSFLESKLSMHKTKFIITRPNPCPFKILCQWREVKHGAIMRYLGTPFGIGVSPKEM